MVVGKIVLQYVTLSASVDFKSVSAMGLVTRY